MKVAVISFTSKGREISNKLKLNLIDKHIEESTEKAKKNKAVTQIIQIDKNTFKDKISNHMKQIFSDYDALIFIASTGIAVRLIAPYVKSKLTDPAVIVVDDLGKYTISLLSGHIGGANTLSKQITNMLKNQLIVTTASDGRGIDAVDTFTVKNDLYIDDMEKAKTLTAMMVEGERIKLISEIELDLNYDNAEIIVLRDYMHSEFEISNTDDFPKGIIIVSSIKDISCYLSEVDREKPICILRPKNLNIGVGCRRGKSKDEIMIAIEKVFREYNLSLHSIGKVGTIDIKHDEQGIIEVSKELGAEMILFSKIELEKVASEFKGSDFVKSQVGVGSVCEPAAYLLGKDMLVLKTVLNGVTIAVSRSDKNG